MKPGYVTTEFWLSVIADERPAPRAHAEVG